MQAVDVPAVQALQEAWHGVQAFAFPPNWPAEQAEQVLAEGLKPKLASQELQAVEELLVQEAHPEAHARHEAVPPVEN